MLDALYLWLKVGHIVSMVAWMAALFYLPRLFVHHAERAPEGSEMSGIFVMMEHKLLKVIMTPAMIATWIFGLSLIVAGGGLQVVLTWWFALKFAAVIALSGFHGWLAARQRAFAAGENEVSGRTYRIMNEVPTVLLLIIVVMVVIQPF